MEPLHVALMLSIILCSLVAGLLFGFAIVVMPGIAKLTDKEFLLAFKHMDGIIQNNQPLFILVWAGSILSIIITFILGIMNLSGTQIYLLIFASILYIFGVQLPTFRFFTMIFCWSRMFGDSFKKNVFRSFCCVWGELLKNGHHWQIPCKKLLP